MMFAQYFSTEPGQSDTASAKPPSQFSRWIRRVHRMLAILFTLTVAANFLAIAFGKVPVWITYSPLPFLFLMMVTGLYMFVLPYVARPGATRPAAMKADERG